jgi:NAD(P)-dependent dehydrogenase (short-subunit alcohol dehydrogenase family)
LRHQQFNVTEPCEDASTNLLPWGILIGGEDLHNNHHTYATSAKLPNKWHEFDIGWMYIRIMAAFNWLGSRERLRAVSLHPGRLRSSQFGLRQRCTRFAKVRADRYEGHITMDLGLNGKVVLITGGSKGIGLACAQAFAREGARVAIVSRDPGNLARAQAQLAHEGLTVDCYSGNMSDAQQAEGVVASVSDALGQIDVLVNSAGAARRYEAESLDAAALRDTMDAKYFPYMFPQQAVLKRMVARRQTQPDAAPGNIVNIIGMGGKVASDFHIAGGAANAALMLATSGFAHYYARYGIRVNAVNPGQTLTTRVDEAVALEAARQGVDKAEAMARGQAAIPLARYARPEEVADVALFLASARAAYVTAAMIPMDGGSSPVI